MSLKKIEENGLEYFGRYYSIYRGIVIDNKDPENAGRLKLKVPQVWGEDLPDIWAYSRGIFSGKGHGLVMIPVPGDPVYVSFELGDPSAPIWEHGWWLEDAMPAEGKGSGKYLFKSPEGHLFILNDETGEVLLKQKDNTTISLKNSLVTITAGKTVKVTGSTVELAGNTQFAVLGNTLKNVLDLLIQQIKLITVINPENGAPLPIVNIAAFEAIRLQLNTILSNFVKLS